MERKNAYAVMHEHTQNKKLLKLGNRVFAQENKRRSQVGEADQKGKRVLLTPADIEQGASYDIKHVFMTTLGGELRAMNEEDFKAFRRNIELLQNQYAKGIKVNDVITLARPIDIQRCNREIHLAMPTAFNAETATVRFMTNASGKHGKTEHHQYVEFTQLTPLISSANELQHSNVQKAVKGKIKFECSCGRHTYWYRYIASVGGFGHGRQETGYPKIRNPNLIGVACKHALRVMQYILSPMFTTYIMKQLEKARKATNLKQQKSTNAQLKKMVEEQYEDKPRALRERVKTAERLLQQRAERLHRKHERQRKREEKKRLAELEKSVGKKQAQEIAKKESEAELEKAFKLVSMTHSKEEVQRLMQKLKEALGE